MRLDLLSDGVPVDFLAVSCSKKGTLTHLQQRSRSSTRNQLSTLFVDSMAELHIHSANHSLLWYTSLYRHACMDIIYDDGGSTRAKKSESKDTK